MITARLHRSPSRCLARSPRRNSLDGSRTPLRSNRGEAMPNGSAGREAMAGNSPESNSPAKKPVVRLEPSPKKGRDVCARWTRRRYVRRPETFFEPVRPVAERTSGQEHQEFHRHLAFAFRTPDPWATSTAPTGASTPAHCLARSRSGGARRAFRRLVRCA